MLLCICMYVYFFKFLFHTRFITYYVIGIILEKDSFFTHKLYMPNLYKLSRAVMLQGKVNFFMITETDEDTISEIHCNQNESC